MIKTFKIDHIDKIEGHAGFVGHIINGQMDKAQYEVKMGIRLFERMVVGRPYMDIPVITARVCGLCPVVHNLTSIKALEKAMDIKPSEQTEDLRKIMMFGQVMQSHAVHVYFLCLADFFKIRHDIDLIKKFPQYTKKAVRVRHYGNELIRIIGGRTVHPLSSVVGGFLKLPDRVELEKLLKEQKEVLKIVQDLGALFAKLNYPQFERESEYISLSNGKEYAIYDGNVISNKGLNIAPNDYEKHIREIHRPFEVLKRVKREDREIFVGALSRVNNNQAKLSPVAKKLLKNSKIKFPNYNSFYNVFAQVLEITHCIEESGKYIEKILGKKYSQALKKYKVKSGKGGAMIEAPRGALYHYYELDKKGVVKYSNIITPTAQFISNIEQDIKAFYPNIDRASDAEKTRKIRMLIRAYDPCMTCTVH